MRVLAGHGASLVKNLPAMLETQIRYLGQEDPLQKGMAIPSPVFLPGGFRGQRSLEGYSIWDHKESDMTNTFTFTWGCLEQVC